jgi:hypothetical protein
MFRIATLHINLRHILILAGVLFLALGLMGCLPSAEYHHADRPAGFFSGIWHGWLAPLSLILQIFNDNVRIYEPHNTGWWYDFGFYMAVITGFGGLSLVRKAHKA